jgi:hypothetical protein
LGIRDGKIKIGNPGWKSPDPDPGKTSKIATLLPYRDSSFHGSRKGGAGGNKGWAQGIEIGRQRGSSLLNFSIPQKLERPSH